MPNVTSDFALSQMIKRIEGEKPAKGGSMEEVARYLRELQRVRAAVKERGQSYHGAFNEGYNAAMDHVEKAMRGGE